MLHLMQRSNFLFNLSLPDKETALLILYYAKRGAKTHTDSLIEAPKIAKIAEELMIQELTK